MQAVHLLPLSLFLSIAQSRSMPLPHSSVHAPFPCFCELSIAQSRSMPLPLSYRVELHHEHLSFQSLCHGNVSLYQVLQGTFNRSVALNAFATMCARLPLQWPQHSFNRSVALNAFATPC